MSEHTKGKLEIIGKGHHAYLDCLAASGPVRLVEIMMPHRFDSMVDAKHLKLCWNSHDDLLAACKAFVEAHEKSHQLEKTDMALRLAKVAIAKYQPKESKVG